MPKVKYKLKPKYIFIDLFTVNRNNYNLKGADLTLPRFNTIRYENTRCGIVVRFQGANYRPL